MHSIKIFGFNSKNKTLAFFSNYFKKSAAYAFPRPKIGNPQTDFLSDSNTILNGD